MKTKPKLREIPLPAEFPERGACYMTMSPGQWDALLSAAYERNWTLLQIEEIGGVEKTTKAYRRQDGPAN